MISEIRGKELYVVCVYVYIHSEFLAFHAAKQAEPKGRTQLQKITRDKISVISEICR